MKMYFSAGKIEYEDLESPMTSNPYNHAPKPLSYTHPALHTLSTIWLWAVGGGGGGWGGDDVRGCYDPVYA